MEQDTDRQGIKERRKAVRFDLFFAMPTLKSINRVDGNEVTLVNLSRRGALLDSHEQMPPDSRIFLRVITAETVYVIRGRITRCGISPTNDDIFQSAIEFDEDFKPMPESIHSLNLFEEGEDFLK